MKKQQKKAFTLVELLVVIAILAILASVAVVGYTAFIKNAAVSNDQNVVAQMNRYLEALKADSSSEYYGKEIDAGNVKQLTAHILQESGMNQLKPEAEKYGYDFYFNFAEGKYEHKHIDEAGASNISRNFFRGTYVFATDGESTETAKETYLENSFTQGNNLFLVSTAGALFDLINSVYALGGTNGECDIETINNFIENDLYGTIIYDVVKEKSTIVRNGSQYRPNGDKSDNASSTVVVIYLNNVTSISATTYVRNEVEPFVATVIANVNKITVPETVSSVDTGALNMNSEEYKVEFSGRTSEEVAAMGVDAMTNAQLELKDGTHKSTSQGIENVETNEVKGYTYENSLKGFAIYDNEETDSVDGIVVSPYATMYVYGNTISVPAEISTLTLVFDYINGSEDSGKPLMGASNITCTTEGVNSTYSVLEKSLTVDFTNQTIPDSFTVTITNNADVTETFTVNVEDITSGSVTFNGATLAEDDTLDMTVITSNSENIGYPIAKGTYAYTHNNLGVCNEAITATFSSDCAEVVYDEDGNCSLLAKTNGSGILTIAVGSEAHTYLTYTVNLTIADTSNFVVQPKNSNNFTVLGNGNAINVSDLFELNGDLPEGAKLVVYSGAVGINDSYMTPDRYVLYSTESGEVGVTVDKPEQVITTDGLSALSLQFAGADPNGTVRIAVVHNGVRISEDIEVSIVDAYNVTDFAQIRTLGSPTKIGSTDKAEVSRAKLSWSDILNFISGESVYSISSKITTIDDDKVLQSTITFESYSLDGSYKVTSRRTETYSYPFSGYMGSSLVLLKDISMGETYNAVTGENVSAVGSYNELEIPSKTTFYGNGFALNLTKGKLRDEGIVELNGTIKDTKIVANVYNTFAFSAADDYGSSAIVARKGAVIENCYVSGARSPLRTTGDVTVKNSVFYGGIFANINITGGNLNIEGEVITINQTKSESSTEKVGMGIAFWWSTDADKSKVVMADGAKLTQYNFISEKDADNMAAASYSGIDAVDLGSIFTEVINSTDGTYAQHIFERSETKYCNTGICYIKEEKTNDSMFNCNSKYGTITYIYDPGAVIGKVMEQIIGSKTLPVVINTLVSENHAENQAFFNSDTTKNAATIFDPAMYGFGADGQIVTNGK